LDQLDITALRVKTRIGVYAWEQRILQALLIDIHIPIECQDFADNIADTLDYSAVCKTVTAHIESNTYQLIETVANEIARIIKLDFPAVNKVTVRVSKPHAIPNANQVSITVQREFLQ
jgi:dihydroneopterin aldolase